MFDGGLIQLASREEEKGQDQRRRRKEGRPKDATDLPQRRRRTCACRRRRRRGAAPSSRSPRSPCPPRSPCIGTPADGLCCVLGLCVGVDGWFCWCWCWGCVHSGGWEGVRRLFVCLLSLSIYRCGGNHAPSTRAWGSRPAPWPCGGSCPVPVGWAVICVGAVSGLWTEHKTHRQTDRQTHTTN